MSIIYFGIAIFIFGTVMPMDPTFKRPECAKEIENKKFGNHYQTVNLANNAENSFNTIDNDEVRIINFEHMEFDVSSIGRELPNETYMSVPDVIKYTGYKVEVHNVITRDGYILEMHRITGKADDSSTNSSQNSTRNKKIPVLLMHGLIESSGCWVLMGKDLGLGFILSDAGYDVWLGNARGNKYSRRHIRYNPDGFHRKYFWSFSWHDIGTIDLPAMIDYILDRTSSNKLHYIGHSQGTTVFFVMCAEKPKYSEKVILMNALAPVALMGHVESLLIRTMVKAYPELKTTAMTFGIYEMTMNNKLLAKFSDAICAEVAPETPLLCSGLLLVLDAFNSKQINCSMVPVIMGHTPAGASVKQYMHYAQNIRSRRFQKYDFDSAIANFIKYGSRVPPLYQIENIHTPIVFFYATEDSVTNHADVDDLAGRLPNLKAKFVVQDPDFTHVDFVYGIHVRTLVYDKLVEMMKEADNQVLIE